MKKLIGLALLTVFLTGCAPLQLDSDSAEDVLFSSRDFSLDLSSADEESDISDSEYPVFNASGDCRPDEDLKNLIEDDGKVLASSDLKSRGESGIYIDQDIVEFDTVEIATEFMDIVREGLDDKDCAYESETDSSNFRTKFEDLGVSQEVFDVASDDSVIWVSDTLAKAVTLNFDLSSDSLTAIVRQNNYILVLEGTIYRDTDVDGSIKDLEEDFALIVRQFVSGKPIDR
jgi:hypothetical protein